MNKAETVVSAFEEDCARERIVSHAFSGIKEGIGVGRWGENVIIFDIENDVLYRVYRSSRGSALIVHVNPEYSSPGELFYVPPEKRVDLGWTDGETPLSFQENRTIRGRLQRQGIVLADYLP